MAKRDIKALWFSAITIETFSQKECKSYKTIYSFVHPTVFYVKNLQFDILSMMQENLMVLALSFCVAREITLN